MPDTTAVQSTVVGDETSGATVGVLRWLRAGAVALASTCLALVSHLTTGGALPRPSTLFPLLLVVLIVSLGLAGRRWTIGPLLAMLFGAQALFHVAAEAGATAHVHGQHVDAASMGGQPSAAMTAAHATAALVTALLLRRGDAWVWRLAELVARAWRVARIVVEQRSSQTASGLGTSTSADLPAALQRLEHTVDRRGPPRRVAA